MKKEDKKDILSEGMKRFQQILEYTTINGIVDEADTPEDNDNAMGGNEEMPPMDDMGGQQPQGGMNPDMGGMNPDMGGNAPAQTPQGFDPQMPQGNGMDAGMMSDNGTNDAVQSDDEVVDITELIDKQDETDEKVIKLGDKFDTVMKALGQFEELIRTQNTNIDNLKAEFEKRNPTQEEKLSMQSSNGYPFNITPNNYWEQKEKTSNYRTEGDDNGKEQPQYTITKKDVDSIGDWKSISDSLNDDDFLFNQSLNAILGR